MAAQRRHANDPVVYMATCPECKQRVPFQETNGCCNIRDFPLEHNCPAIRAAVRAAAFAHSKRIVVRPHASETGSLLTLAS